MEEITSPFNANDFKKTNVTYTNFMYVFVSYFYELLCLVSTILNKKCSQMKVWEYTKKPRIIGLIMIRGFFDESTILSFTSSFYLRRIILTPSKP